MGTNLFENLGADSWDLEQVIHGGVGSTVDDSLGHDISDSGDGDELLSTGRIKVHRTERSPGFGARSWITR